MHTDYTKLIENHIGVWSVKTDAFVIRKEHLRRKSLGKTDKYEVGEILICRLYKKTNNVKFNVNYRFKIVSISKNIIKLENVKSKQQYLMDIATLVKHFRYDYCTTCHSAQGASIDGKIVIHEWEKSHLVTREWLWCTLTRSTDFNNVLFYESAEAENELNETTLHKYWLNKINAYKLQDQKANREIDDSKYVNPSWFMKRVYSHCNNWGCNFEFEFKNGFLTSNMTAQRLDNSIGHESDNCEAWCKLCNCSAR